MMSARKPRLPSCIALLVLLPLLPGCLTKMQPATVSAQHGADDVLVSARRAMSEQGLSPASQDDEAGVLYSDWVVHTSTDDSAYLYRLVVFVDEAGGQSSVTVRAETQNCPPNVTVFDRCTQNPGRIVPKSVQAKIEAVSARLASS
jgi:uncharacterized lipoprotein